MDRLPQVDRLVWDDWNREHIAKHRVTPEEAAEVIIGNPSARATYKNRFQIVGPTAAGRMLSIVVGSVPTKPDTYYVFSARPASRKERAAHVEQKGGPVS